MCIFCDVVCQRVPIYKINWENKFFVVFLDRYPIERGHCLLVTKVHYDNYLECPNDVLAQAQPIIKKIISRLEKKLGAKGFHVTTNIHKIGNQEVKHFHWHIIPRYVGGSSIIHHPKRLALSKVDFCFIQKQLSF